LLREGRPLPYGWYWFCILCLLGGRSRTPVPTGVCQFCILHFAFCVCYVCCGRADPSPTGGIGFAFCACWADGRGRPSIRGYVNFAFCILHFAFCVCYVCCGRADPSPTGGIGFAFCVCWADGRGRPSLRGYVNFAFCILHFAFKNPLGLPLLGQSLRVFICLFCLQSLCCSMCRLHPAVGRLRHPYRLVRLPAYKAFRLLHRTLAAKPQYLP